MLFLVAGDWWPWRFGKFGYISKTQAIQIVVSSNCGIPKIKTIGFSTIFFVFWMIRGYPHFRKPPNASFWNHETSTLTVGFSISNPTKECWLIGVQKKDRFNYSLGHVETNKHGLAPLGMSCHLCDHCCWPSMGPEVSSNIWVNLLILFWNVHSSWREPCSDQENLRKPSHFSFIYFYFYFYFFRTWQKGDGVFWPVVSNRVVFQDKETPIQSLGWSKNSVKA